MKRPPNPCPAHPATSKRLRATRPRQYGRGMQKNSNRLRESLPKQQWRPRRPATVSAAPVQPAARSRAGLEDVRLHDLRYSWASRALALDESLPMIGKLLGYSQVETTARHAHLARDSVHEAATRIAASVGADLLGVRAYIYALIS